MNTAYTTTEHLPTLPYQVRKAIKHFAPSIREHVERYCQMQIKQGKGGPTWDTLPEIINEVIRGMFQDMQNPELDEHIVMASRTAVKEGRHFSTKDAINEFCKIKSQGCKVA